MKVITQRNKITLQTIRLLLASIVGLVCAVSTFTTASAVPQKKSTRWVSTKLLDEALDQVSAQPTVAGWASKTKQILDVVASAELTTPERIVQISLLDQQRRRIELLYPRLANSVLAENDRRLILDQLQQLNHQLVRRTVTWSAIVNLQGEASQQPELQPVDFVLSGVGSEWSDYLLLDELQTAFALPADKQKAKRLAARHTLARVFSVALKPVQAKYVQSLFSEADIQLLKSYASRKVDPSRIANRLELYETHPGSRSGFLLNDVLQDLLWSEDPAYQHAAEVIQLYYRNGNFRLTISEAFMNRLLPQLPTIAEPVSETIQGAVVSGRSRVSNEVIVNLVPDAHQLNFQIQTNGRVQSDTVAKTKGFRIMNQGHATFDVYKKISVNANGIDASQKAYSTSTARQLLVGIQSKIDNVPVFGKLARRVAAKKVHEQSPEANQMFRRKVTQAAEARVEEEIAKQVDVVRTAANKNLLQPLIELDLNPTPLGLKTTESEIEIRYRLAGRDQMAANTARPATSNRSMVTIQLHQSLVNNVIARLGLNGGSFTGQELAKHLQDVLGLDVDASSDENQKDAQFKFAGLDPIRIDFKDGRVNVVINLDSLQVGGAAKPIRRLSITAAYTIEADGMQVRLTQDDTGTRVTSRGKRLRLGDRAVVSTVMKMLFQPSYSLNALPKKFRERPQAQSLVISSLIVYNGWLAVEMDDVLVAQSAPIERSKPEPRLGENLRRMFKQR